MVGKNLTKRIHRRLSLNQQQQVPDDTKQQNRRTGKSNRLRNFFPKLFILLTGGWQLTRCSYDAWSTLIHHFRIIFFFLLSLNRQQSAARTHTPLAEASSMDKCRAGKAISTERAGQGSWVYKSKEQTRLTHFLKGGKKDPQKMQKKIQNTKSGDNFINILN